MLTLRRGRLAISCLLVALGLLGGCESSPTAPSSQLRFVYAALGASDAVGIGAIPISEGYVFEIADKLRSVRANVQLVNLGINGARIERFLAEQLQPAIASNPQIITIWTGSVRCRATARQSGPTSLPPSWRSAAVRPWPSRRSL